jgi:hypothetical protein
MGQRLGHVAMLTRVLGVRGQNLQLFMAAFPRINAAAPAEKVLEMELAAL